MEDVLASCSAALFPDQLGKARVNLSSVDCDGDTPLHVVLRRNDNDAALLLIAAGAKVGAVGDMSETPLHIAARLANREVIAALLRAGADPEAVSEFGQTPRSLAAARGIKLGSAI